MLNRRRFLQSGVGASLISAAPAVPFFIPHSVEAAAPASDNGNILVVLEMDGGNDGINTVVPFQDEGYQKHRKSLRINRDKLVQIADDLGFNPGLRALAPDWENGNVAVVQGVGYPNPNRSHFRSMDIWHSARTQESEQFGLGWLGQAFDGSVQPTETSTMMSIGRQATPLALVGQRSVATSIQSIEQCILPAERIRALESISQSSVTSRNIDETYAFVRRTHVTATQTASRLRELGKSDHGAERYPDSWLARQLQLVARLMRAELGTRVFYVQQSGYDTHAGQLPHHRSLLSDFAKAIHAFLADLKSSKFASRVVIMAFSEFGRRVAENASEGTDHGTAGPVFLAGEQIKGGLHGNTPRLTELEEGDLKMHTDFRQVYATLLSDWLGLDPAASLGEEFKHVDFIGG